ncbi:tRNA uridine-5-carboxymethylaminomethyl(34) synthesis GTPase MnmE [Ochrobactrum quorumnocens]|uniref:tRNA modification GTPase MnmE n=1 Tax=Ochrobactrum quorumnocens TaxID=271865 RepID=A0A248UI79_9HYPH|nr:tRNA uridine-5-carboxymethylaminomethyl(34) synthesis GTPase MnmE [[Ochrobactrum] quorumnocens]ASV86435.1 tRNA modification GTPase TrmE [[Ochrobactrum] quorumnocens]KAA9369287.1 tRNA uridine-5-carboxymethylaminomethyl(34) synthesis GTPase MnmE [[Ochrobactrum] quorumnocens]MBD7991189.1 tRNA uridine-5-carboxymethylaminomethyl(34) synthesis GTPase MnmE [Ochrobactrum gallinarum]
MSERQHLQDTIFALSSGRLPSGVAVVRISGPQVRFVVETIIEKMIEPRYAAYKTFRARNGDAIDRGLALFFPGPNSFTGEDCAEFHLHGGIAVVEKLLEELGSFPNCRIAEAGEFTRRAFTNGKMDLTIAEGLADLIAAETEGQRRLALQVASGAQRQLYTEWRQRLVRARALIEAELDFADESDVPGSVSGQVWEELRSLRTAILRHIESGKRAAMLRDGLHVVITGAPNAGKSSLLNFLAGREVAIISEEAGTTRDLLEVKLNLAGIPVYVTDTAGLRETTSKVEKIGIERALERAAEADLVLLLEDMQNPIAVSLDESEADVWTVGTKVDLSNSETGGWKYRISTKTNAGLVELLAALQVFAENRIGQINDAVPTRQRHINLLQSTVSEIETAANRDDLPLELRAENMRHASQYLGRITGDVDVEEILDVIFSQFCIGK